MTEQTNTPVIDPFADREAEKYDNPIPSREFILEHLEELQKPTRLGPLAKSLGIDEDDEERFEALSRRLKAMLRDGQLIKNRRGAFGLLQKMDLIKGSVTGHPDGFGFVASDQVERDLLLSSHEMHKVLHGDEVIVSIIGEDRRGRQEAAIVEVTRRANEEIVGRIHFEQDLAWVHPNNNRITQDVFIPADGLLGATEGQIVRVSIMMHPSHRHGPVGKIVEVLGDYMAPGMEIDTAIQTFNIPNKWSEALLTELEAIPSELTEQDYADRKDLRSLPLVTIDGEDSKDFDDAVFAKRRKNGWRLVVAIADVSHYVKPGTELDKEAFERGNSVYFPQRVIPMLPEKLSNDLCSLNPHVDRVCMVCDMSISEEGQLERSQFYQAVMNSKARLTYNQVHQMVNDSTSALRDEFAPVVAAVDNLYELYQVLHAARAKRGALEFDTVETRIVFDGERKIDKIVPVVRNQAHRLIEECMLMANVAAARYLKWHKLPIVYRVHEPPKAEKLTKLRGFLKDFGLALDGGDEPTAQDFDKVLQAAQGLPSEHLIKTIMLRTMNQAVYQPENKGHFGLNFEHYAHFTSPIRRYPDLLIHRAIRQAWLKQGEQGFAYNEEDMTRMGRHCSDTERRADEATRDAVTFLKCEFLSHRLGEEYDAVISSVTNFGMFVELDPLYIEGLVHVTELGEDYFHFDAVRHCLKGERTGKVYRIGDRVKVQVAQVVLDTRKIDLRLISGTEEEQATSDAIKQPEESTVDANEAAPESVEAEQGEVKKKRRSRSRSRPNNRKRRSRAKAKHD
ncbi:ribonuclease R [Thiomicrospira sp. ALE5]|uniref:ribonuclease R n=1 Tax=Thiomicrospira sp. ALE5 TaxID=748650 RepID=UPI0008EF1342|nr:ribonuclease R [Thiomicrospira sp. ALE5]SFR53044.1 ribonuclease R [Thiomicrospira sp. ALE5]